MITKKHTLILLLLALFTISGCKKDDIFDPQKQFETDEQLIKDFIAANNIANAVRDDTGVYYVILEAAPGNLSYNTSTMIDVDYVGKLLNGSEFDSNPSFQYPLGNLIPGWQIGIPKIQPGGRIRLLIPSYYAYGRNPTAKIPANSVLDFTITLKRAGF